MEIVWGPRMTRYALATEAAQVCVARSAEFKSERDKHPSDAKEWARWNARVAAVEGIAQDILALRMLREGEVIEADERSQRLRLSTGRNQITIDFSSAGLVVNCWNGAGNEVISSFAWQPGCSLL